MCGYTGNIKTYEAWPVIRRWQMIQYLSKEGIQEVFGCSKLSDKPQQPENQGQELGL